MNESDPRSNVHYLGSSESAVHITARITFIHVFIRSSKNLVSGNGKCSRLEPQDKDFSAYAPPLFFNYIFFLFMFFQILTSVK